MADATTPPIQFLFALHDHQPVGNFDHVFEDAYARAYAPLLEVLEGWPGFRVCLHHTGPLLEWIEAHRPQYLERLGALVARGQVELLGGAFFEPILPVIPERDRIGQIEMMSDWLERVFGVRPRGMWLAERVWEPSLPRAMAAAGIEYTVLDDQHFKAVGLEEQDTLGYFLTEDEGYAVAVFPIHSRVRQQIPYVEPPETIALLRGLARPDAAVAVTMADDGEKFGVWPDSHRHCYEDGYMYRLAEMLQNNAGWLHMKTFSEVLDETAPISRIYLPTASYVEMMEWALPASSLVEYKRLKGKLGEASLAEAAGPYLRGGFWRSFFARYEEANHIHKKMLRVGAKIEEARESLGDSEVLDQAQDHLWRAQCNCGYWHGVFGGLYLTNLRTALYKHLIAAEDAVDRLVRKGRQWLHVEVVDMDVDGRPELVVESPWQTLVFQPHAGGMLVEHDIRAARFNLLDTLMRRREAYHDELLQGSARIRDRGLERYLAVDDHRRGALIEHFLDDEASPQDFRSNSHAERGGFVGAPYACEWTREGSRLEAAFTAEAVVETAGGPRDVLLSKTVRLSAAETGYSVDYSITNQSSEPLETRFAVESNINLLAGDAHDRVHVVEGHDLAGHDRMVSIGAVPGVSEYAVRDGWLRLDARWRLDAPAEHWRLPIETAANSVDGVERIYQSTVVMPVWRISVPPGGTWRVGMEMRVSNLG